MKTLTNHTIGAKGINLADGSTLWIEPGQSVDVDPKDIVGKVPDLGRKSDAPAADAGELDALKEQVAALTKQVEDLTKDKADLTKQVEDLTKPAK